VSGFGVADVDGTVARHPMGEGSTAARTPFSARPHGCVAAPGPGRLPPPVAGRTDAAANGEGRTAKVSTGLLRPGADLSTGHRVCGREGRRERWWRRNRRAGSHEGPGEARATGDEIAWELIARGSFFFLADGGRQLRDFHDLCDIATFLMTAIVRRMRGIARTVGRSDPKKSCTKK